MDPQQRLLLETTAEVLLTASRGGGAEPRPLQQQPWWGGVGAYVGIASSDYGSLVKAHAPAGEAGKQHRHLVPFWIHALGVVSYK